MYKATKVLNLVSIVIDVIMFILFLVLGFSMFTYVDSLVYDSHYPDEGSMMYQMIGAGMIAVSFVFTIGISFSIIYNQKLKNAKCAADIRPWSIVMLFFGYFIVGLLGLLIEDKDFPNNSNNKNVESEFINSFYSSSTTSTSKTETLKNLKKLYEEGVLTEEEYIKKTSDLIDKM